MEEIRVAGVVKQSIVDGPGLRYVVFCQGCPHRCPGCHNPHTHDFDGGYGCSVQTILAEMDKNPLLSGITLSGGEPFCQASALVPLAKAVRRRGKHVFAFSGFTFEELLEQAQKDPGVAELLTLVDTLVDGRYDQTLRDLTLRFRGSSNQRMLDLPRSLESGAAVELSE